MTRGRRCYGSGRLWRRGKSWLLDYRTADGRRCHKTLGTDRRTAEAIRARIIEQRNLQTFGLLDVAGQQRSLAELVAEYLTDLQPRVSERHYSIVASRLQRTLAKLGPVAVGQLRATDVARVRNETAKELGLSNRAANLVADSVCACLRWATEAGVIAQSPVARLRRLPERPEDQRYRRRAMSDDEIERFLAASEADDQACAPMHELENRTRVPQTPMWRLFLDTGARWNELRQATWADVDVWRALLTLRAESTKSRRQRVIPLRRELVDMLRGLQTLHQRALRRPTTPNDRLLLSPDGLGFGHPTTCPMRTLDRVLARAGIPKVGADGRKLDLHALRHTFATRLARAGVGLAQTQRLLGHSDPKLTARVYTHLEAEDLRGAVEALRHPGWDVSAVAAAR